MPPAAMTPLGALLSIAGNVCIGLGFRLSPHSALVWRLGSALMAAGECLNFAAYGLAPASLVAPLDAVAFVIGGRPGRTALGMAVAGVAGAVLNAPQADDEDPIRCVTSWRAAVLGAVAGVVGLWVANPLNLRVAVSHSARRAHPFHYCFLGGLMGALTAVAAKGLSAALWHVVATGGTAPWLVCASLLATIAVSVNLQMRSIGAALDAGFGQGVVVPVYYVCFTAIAVVAGAIVFRETVFVYPAHPVLFGASLILAYAGLFAVGGGAQEVADNGGGKGSEV